MKMLLGALPGDGWKVFGLMGRGGRWFLGFSHVFRGNAIDWEQRNAQLRKEVLELDMKNLALDIENERLRKQIATCRPTANPQEQPKTAGGSDNVPEA